MEDNTTSQPNKQLPVIAAAVVAIVAFVGVGAMVLSRQNSAVMQDKTADTSGVQIIAVEAGGFYYKPNEIRVKKGQTVKIEMKSVDMMHDFNIDELGVKIPITKSGETAVVEFTADKVGEFEFYCSVGEHRQKGQVGKLIVE